MKRISKAAVLAAAMLIGMGVAPAVASASIVSWHFENFTPRPWYTNYASPNLGYVVDAATNAVAEDGSFSLHNENVTAEGAGDVVKIAESDTETGIGGAQYLGWFYSDCGGGAPGKIELYSVNASGTMTTYGVTILTYHTWVKAVTPSITSDAVKVGYEILDCTNAPISIYADNIQLN